MNCEYLSENSKPFPWRLYYVFHELYAISGFQSDASNTIVKTCTKMLIQYQSELKSKFTSLSFPKDTAFDFKL